MKGHFQKKPEITSGRNSRKPKPPKGRGGKDDAGQKSPRVGRPRSGPAQLPIFDTLQQCSAATGVPLTALKMAKASGCDAFRHGRVSFGEFIRWFFARGTQEDNTDWLKENKRLDALIKRVRLAELEKRLIDFAEVNRFLQTLVGTCFFAQLERMSNEFPPVFKGRDENEIQARILADIEKVKADLSAKLQSWSGPQK